MSKLSDKDIKQRLGDLDGWERDGDHIERTFEFDDFSSAWGFMSRVALLAETQNHHPEWTNVYNRVLVRLTTHDADGISDKDFTLASAINALA